MKKLLKFTLLFFLLLNFFTIAKSEIIQGFCLVKRSDLDIAKLATEDYYRFLGKEIKFLVSFDEKLLADESEEGLSVITGMYGGALEFDQKLQKNGKILTYKNEINVTGDKETDLIKYSYKNKLQIVDNKITSFTAVVDQTGFSTNKWYFQIDCRDYPYTEDEKLEAYKKPKPIINKKIDCPENIPEYMCELMQKIENEKNTNTKPKTNCPENFPNCKYYLEKLEQMKNSDEIIKKPEKKNVNNFDVKTEYTCMVKGGYGQVGDVKILLSNNTDTPAWTISTNTISKVGMVVGSGKYLIENSCCPEKGQRLGIYDEDAKLKWFDLSDGYLYLDLIEKTDDKIQHKKFSLLIEPSLTERINKLFDGAEKAKKSYNSDLISVNSYIGEEEKFFYSAKAIYRDSKNSKSVFHAVCE
tara:strand:+ start:506 stop:1744 length:1239 start_codon:yes stop_codon:yes gene_type:complete